MALPEGTRLYLLSPIVRGRKGEYRKEFAELQRAGFQRVKVDGKLYELDEAPKLNKKLKHDIELVVDRLVLAPGLEQRLAESIETALARSDGLLLVENADSGEQHAALGQVRLPGLGLHDRGDRAAAVLVQQPARRLPGLRRPRPPALHGPGPRGARPREEPLRRRDRALVAVDLDLLSADARRHRQAFPREPAHAVGGAARGDAEADPRGLGRGGGRAAVRRRPAPLRHQTGRSRACCPTCSGAGARPRAPGSRTSSAAICRARPARPAAATGSSPRRSRSRSAAATSARSPSSRSSRRRPGSRRCPRSSPRSTTRSPRASSRRSTSAWASCSNVGLGYLTLARDSGSLSGGESQRIRLASQIGSGLTGVLYVLDEPSIGLHQRDNHRLLETLKNLRDLGNTVIVVEHDEDAIREADHVVDMGPGAGMHGGLVVAEGTPAEILAAPESLTGQYLVGRRQIPLPLLRRQAKQRPLADARRRGREQPQGRDRGDPARHLHLHHRRLGQRQVDARARHALPGARQAAAQGAPAAGRARAHRRHGVPRQGRRHRPVADRPHAALQPRDLHRLLHADPRLVRRPARGQGARLPARPLLVQRQGRALRGLPGRRPDQDRDALSAGRLRHLRRLPGPALQPRDARGPLPRQVDRRRARHDGRELRPSCSTRCRRCATSSRR